MRGHVRKRGAKWYVIVELPRELETGKRKQKWIPAGATKKEAEKMLNGIVSELYAGTFVEPRKMLFAEYLEWWLENQCKIRLSTTTYESYARNVQKHIIPALGRIELSKLAPIQLQQFYSSCLQRGKVGKTVLYYHRIIHSALTKAVRLELVSRNAADYVDPPKPSKYQAGFLDEKQVNALLEAAKDSLIYIPILLAISTGMRRGEVLGLNWENIDFGKGLLFINQTLLVTNSGIEFLPPKSEKSRRLVSLPPSVTAELIDHKKRQVLNKLKMGQEYQDNDLVCCYPEGRPFNPGTFSHMFKNFIDQNELPSIRFHDLRHSHASLLGKFGVSAKAVQERLGHSSISITMDIYTHVFQETHQEVADQFDKILGRNKECEDEMNFSESRSGLQCLQSVCKHKKKGTS